jgi:putative SOS response-associated peptidase YedK
MCEQVIQTDKAVALGIRVVEESQRQAQSLDIPPRAGPGQDHLIIRQNHKTGARSLNPLRWGLIPSWCKEPPKPKPPVAARGETVASMPMFRDAYAKRRAILPINGFFEWRATKGAREPYTIAMRDEGPFAVAAIWENWKDPANGTWTRTFCILTVAANELVAGIHDRMPLILRAEDHDRWLGLEPDPRDLIRPFPAVEMRICPFARVDHGADDPDLFASP